MYNYRLSPRQIAVIDRWLDALAEKNIERPETKSFIRASQALGIKILDGSHTGYKVNEINANTTLNALREGTIGEFTWGRKQKPQEPIPSPPAIRKASTKKSSSQIEVERKLSQEDKDEGSWQGR